MYLEVVYLEVLLYHFFWGFVDNFIPRVLEFDEVSKMSIDDPHWKKSFFIQKRVDVSVTFFEFD